MTYPPLLLLIIFLITAISPSVKAQDVPTEINHVSKKFDLLKSKKIITDQSLESFIERYHNDHAALPAAAKKSLSEAEINKAHKQFQWIRNNGRYKDLHTVYRDDIQSAACATSLSPTTEDLEEWISEYPNLADQAIKAFNLPYSFLHEPFCKNSFCKIEKAFDYEMALRLIFAYHLGFNASHYAADDSSNQYLLELMNYFHTASTTFKAWRASEIDIVLKGVLDFPTQYLGQGVILPLTRASVHPRTDKNGGVAANSFTTVYDLTFAKEIDSVQYIIFHELVHNYDKKNSLSSLNCSESNNEQSNKEQCSSLYGESDAEEDIAESFSNYRYTPQYSKSISDKKYAWIKSALNNLEFNDEKNCAIDLPITLNALKTKATEEAIASRIDGSNLSPWGIALITQRKHAPNTSQPYYLINVLAKHLNRLEVRQDVTLKFLQSQ